MSKSILTKQTKINEYIWTLKNINLIMFLLKPFLELIMLIYLVLSKKNGILSNTIIGNTVKRTKFAIIFVLVMSK